MRRWILLALALALAVLLFPIAVGAASHSPALDGLVELFKANTGGLVEFFLANLQGYIAFVGAL